MGELVYVATVKGHLEIVRYLIEDHNVDPVCVGDVRV